MARTDIVIENSNCFKRFCIILIDLHKICYNLLVMIKDNLPSLHHRLRRLKAALLAVSLTLAGILLMMLNAWLAPLRL